MILKNNKLFYSALFLCLPSFLPANITTLQHWDPAPSYNAANLNMAPDTQFCYAIKKRLLNEDVDKRRRFGLNISPFAQRAIRAQQADDIYLGIHGITTILPGREISDLHGTPYLMGLFLGQDVSGNSIWGGPVALDTGVVTDITTTTVGDTLLPTNVQNAINALNDNDTASNPSGMIFNTPTNSAGTAPSIFSQSVLEQDKAFFGAFSVPLVYEKSGFRWEVNFDISNSIGAIVRSGFCQMTQKASSAQSLTTQSTQPDGATSIYNQLNNIENGDTSPYTTLSQQTFNEWVSNNTSKLLDATNGVDYDISTFSSTGIEDIQLLAFIRHPFLIHSTDTEKYSSIIVTPYTIVGWTIPITPVRNYSKLYALPFGNNSHTSVGGVVGLTLDFMSSLEFGFEFGATGFLKKTIYELPCPNHELQRAIYPYRQDVSYSPGFNGQFAAIFNAYEFAHNTSFSFKYNYVQHNKDTITLITPSQYFFPNMLEEESVWSSQMFTAALTFEIQPSIYLSAAWQGALSQKNAYCTNTLIGSLNFQF